MTPLQGRIALLGTAVLALAAGFGLAHEMGAAPQTHAPQLASGTWLPQPRSVGDFRLEDTEGRPFTARDLRGRAHLLYFGFTHCPDVCPTTLVKLAAVVKALPAPPQVVFVSVDPARDTPDRLATYVHAFDPGFIGVTGDEATLQRMATQFQVVISKVPLPGGDYTMDHSAVLFLLTPRGEIGGIFTPPFDTQALIRDLRTAAPALAADG